MDPRLDIIGKRLAQVGRIIAVTGGKGGIGKSLVASTLALNLADAGARVGLLDLDLTGPCDHVILGIEAEFPEEHFGLVPLMAQGIRFMSITCFTGPRPAPLRGADVSNALIELLTITQWGALDVLVIDMPPGLGDATLDAVRLLKQAEFLILATSSRVVLETVRRTLELLVRLRVRILGVVENMQRGESAAIGDLAAGFQVPFLGSLPYDPQVEEGIGHVGLLGQTAFAAALREVAGKIGGMA